MPTLTAFLTGIAVGAFGLAGVAVALFALLCWGSQAEDEEMR
jgi:hypothetical protein